MREFFPVLNWNAERVLGRSNETRDPLRTICRTRQTPGPRARGRRGHSCTRSRTCRCGAGGGCTRGTAGRTAPRRAGSLGRRTPQSQTPSAVNSLRGIKSAPTPAAGFFCCRYASIFHPCQLAASTSWLHQEVFFVLISRLPACCACLPGSSSWKRRSSTRSPQGSWLRAGWPCRCWTVPFLQPEIRRNTHEENSGVQPSNESHSIIGGWLP